METYKIGNKVKCIIRSFSPGKIGAEEMIYSNQPYTILDGASAELHFKDVSRTAKDDTQRLMFHNMSMVDTITISNIQLTNKIMNLIFPKSETKLAHVAENYNSDEYNQIFLNHSGPIYQVFVYNNKGELEKDSCQGQWDAARPISVEKSDSNYLIVYSFEKEVAFNLNNFNNIYLTVDLEIQGNTDDSLNKMWIHLDKCGLHVDKNMYFNQNSNAVDLVFEIISDRDTENYITVK